MITSIDSYVHIYKFVNVVILNKYSEHYHSWLHKLLISQDEYLMLSSFLILKSDDRKKFLSIIKSKYIAIYEACSSSSNYILVLSYIILPITHILLKLSLGVSLGTYD